MLLRERLIILFLSIVESGDIITVVFAIVMGSFSLVILPPEMQGMSVLKSIVNLTKTHQRLPTHVRQAPSSLPPLTEFRTSTVQSPMVRSLKL